MRTYNLTGCQQNQPRGSKTEKRWRRRSQHSKKVDKSAQTHAGTVSVPCNLDLWPLDPKINGFPGLIVDHFYVESDDPNCISLWGIVWKLRQTDKQTDSQIPVKTLPPPLPSAYRWKLKSKQLNQENLKKIGFKAGVKDWWSDESGDSTNQKKKMTWRNLCEMRRVTSRKTGMRRLMMKWIISWLQRPSLMTVAICDFIP